MSLLKFAVSSDSMPRPFIGHVPIEIAFLPILAVGIVFWGMAVSVGYWYLRPGERSQPHFWLGQQVIMTACLSGIWPDIGPGQPWWPPHYFLPRWTWAFGEYEPSVSPWMEGRGSSCCSTCPRRSWLYRVGWPIFSHSRWSIWVSWLMGVWNTSVPVGGLCQSCRGLAWVILEGVLPYNIVTLL